MTKIDRTRIKMVVSDMDGTLLLHGAQSLDRRSIRVLQRLQEHGIRFVAASGRQWYNVQNLCQQLHQPLSMIVENGAMTVLDGKVVSKHCFAPELVREMMTAMQQCRSAELLFSGERSCYICPKTDWYLDLVVNVVKNRTTVVADPFAIEDELVKISMWLREGTASIFDSWRERFGDRAHVVTSGNGWLDMVPKGVNKGTALREIMEYYQLRPEECMVFGDNYNDIEMLTMVPHSYAMEEGEERAKRAAQYTTPLVAQTLEEWLEELEETGGKHD